MEQKLHLVLSVCLVHPLVCVARTKLLNAPPAIRDTLLISINVLKNALLAFINKLKRDSVLNASLLVKLAQEMVLIV